jgi:hypothetical protein
MLGRPGHPVFTRFAMQADASATKAGPVEKSGEDATPRPASEPRKAA